jgi:preprotein translocase subunit YajC
MGSLVLFVPFLLIMGGFMYFASRKQRRVMQATIDLHESLRPGDRVHTTSGMEATITAIGDDNVDLEIAPGVVTTWMKLAIRDRILPEDDDDLDEDLDDDGEAGYQELGTSDHEAHSEAHVDPSERETQASKEF